MHKHTSRRSSKPVSSDLPTPSASSLTQTWWRWLVITPHSPAPPHTSLGLGIVYCNFKIRFLHIKLWYSFPRHLFKRTRKNKYWPRSGPFHSHLHFLTSPPLFRPVCSNSKKCHVFSGLPVAHFTALSHRLFMRDCRVRVSRPVAVVLVCLTGFLPQGSEVETSNGPPKKQPDLVNLKFLLM